ncbi:hypothetical protein QQ045_016911 [Rhodiola kirilowii]
MVILDSEVDAVTALTSPIRKVRHAMFRLFRYSADYDPRKESSATTKLVRLPGLPPPLFTRRFVEVISNSFGRFLDVDERSKACSTLKYARACVELDMSQPISEEVVISLSDGRSFCQKIQVEGNMSYCSHFKIHGHELSNCRKKRAVKMDDVVIKHLKQIDTPTTKGNPQPNTSSQLTSQKEHVTKSIVPKESVGNLEWVEKDAKGDKTGAPKADLVTNTVVGDTNTAVVPKSWNNANENNEVEDILEGELLD